MKKRVELENIVGLKKREIERYEDAELAERPMTRNEYGHLLYDEDAIDRLWQLRFYKELGYNIPAIKKRISQNELSKRDELEKVIHELQDKRQHLDDLISIAQAMKEMGVSFITLKKTIVDNNVHSNQVFGTIASSLNLFSCVKEEDFIADFFLDEEIEKIHMAIERMLMLSESGETVDSPNVQAEAECIHNIIARGFSKSMLFFKGFLIHLEPKSEIAEELEETYGKKGVNYLCKALNHYCNVNTDNETDQKLFGALERIGELEKKKYPADSLEVQSEVKKLHQFFDGMAISKEKVRVKWLRNLGESLASNEVAQILECESDRRSAHFLSCALDTYCKKI